ncbi:MAG: hypothetical protein CMJ46_00385 [Planctomyces sp.]|nr:hypothetical protein [Planctomyces sp.]
MGNPAYFPNRDASRLTEEEKQRWITWMKEVFHPLNERVERLILDNLDLVEGDTIPVAFREALAHVVTYRAVLAQWAAGDYSEYLSINNWPGADLMAAVKPHYEKIRSEQRRLLGQRH